MKRINFDWLARLVYFGMGFYFAKGASLWAIALAALVFGIVRLLAE